MDTNQTLAAVRERYGAIARQSRSCCGPTCCAPDGPPEGQAVQPDASQLGYSAREQASAPEGSNLGLGCGNPQAIAALEPGEDVLDLGSGAGFDCFLAAQAVGPTGSVIGVDMTPDMLARARQNATKVDARNIEFRLGEIEHLPVADDSVDVVMSNCVVNLSPEKERVFSEIARVLKPGGQMLISDIVVDDAPAWLRPVAALYSACVAGAVSEAEYVGGLRRAGLEAVEVRARHVYDGAALEDLIRTEAPGLVAWPAARVLAGKVKSVKVYARRPA